MQWWALCTDFIRRKGARSLAGMTSCETLISTRGVVWHTPLMLTRVGSESLVAKTSAEVVGRVMNKDRGCCDVYA